MDLITPLGEQIRERMYTDFHNDVIAHYGPSRGAARVVKILCLIEDIGVRCLSTMTKYRHSYTVLRTMLTHSVPYSIRY